MMWDVRFLLGLGFLVLAGGLQGGLSGSGSEASGSVFPEHGASSQDHNTDPDVMNNSTSVKEEEIDHESHNSSEHETEHGHGKETHRYHVAVLDFDHVSTPYIISLWVLLASLAKIVFHSTERLSRIFPESCLLIVLGVVFGIVLFFSTSRTFIMSSQTFFLYLLPPIILEAGYFMPIRAFFDNLGTILVFAVIGTIFNTLLIGVSIWGFSGMGLGVIPLDINPLHCLVFAALISAVDPVAVLAVFEEVHVNDVLHIVVFGESLLNDGVSVVLYHMFETYSHIGQENILPVDIVAGIGSFFAVAGGGTLIGIIVGFIAAFLSRFTSHVPVIEPLLVFLMGYLSYLTAEVFHFSGILACTFCGITMRRYVEANISRKSHTTVKYFMKMLASVCETIIFVFLGLSTVTNNHEWNTSFILLTLVFCLVYRAIGVILLTFLANLFRVQKLNNVEQFIMAYGGLRGAIAFSLVILLSADVFPQKRLMVTTTVVVIYFTVFIQGVTIKPLVNILNVQRSNKHKPSMNEQIHVRLTDHLMAGIEDITGNFGHHEIRARFENFNSKYLKPLLVRRRNQPNIQRGSSIVNVYRKLMEHDAQEHIKRHGSFNMNKMHEDMLSGMSLSQIFHSYSQASIHSNHSEDSNSNKNSGGHNGLPLTDNTSHTCLDMNALEMQEGRKMRDDSRAHHILDDTMFIPRKRFSHSRQKHALSDPKIVEQVHHTLRYNLRSISRSHHRPTRSHHHHEHTSNKGSSKGASSSEEDNHKKPKKNVSFADQINKHNSEDGGNDDDSINVELSEDKSDTSSEAGITFTVKEPEPAPSPPLQPPPEPTAVELSLPWKRNTGRLPVSSSSTHALPSDDMPQVGEAPAWVEGDPLVESQENINLATAHENGLVKPSIHLDFKTAAPGDLSLTLNHQDEQEAPKSPSKQESANDEKVSETYETPFPWKNDTDDCKEEEVSPLVDKEEDIGGPLPPPWKEYSNGNSGSNGDDGTAYNKNSSRGTPALVLDVHIASPIPIRDRHAKERRTEESLPPLPWRTPSTEADSVPVRSPSCSKELDSYSLQPHPSTHSLRLSEAESRHSEPFHLHHHVLDLPVRGVELDWSAILEDTDLVDGDLDPAAHAQETWSRVNAWLLSCEPEVSSGDLEENGPHEHYHNALQPKNLSEVEIVVQNPDASAINLETVSTPL